MWKSPHEGGAEKESEREYCSMLNNPNIVIYIYIYIYIKFWSPRTKGLLVILAFIRV